MVLRKWMEIGEPRGPGEIREGIDVNWFRVSPMGNGRKGHSRQKEQHV